MKRLLLSVLYMTPVWFLKGHVRRGTRHQASCGHESGKASCDHALEHPCICKTQRSATIGLQAALRLLPIASGYQEARAACEGPGPVPIPVALLTGCVQVQHPIPAREVSPNMAGKDAV